MTQKHMGWGGEITNMFIHVSKFGNNAYITLT